MKRADRLLAVASIVTLVIAYFMPVVFPEKGDYLPGLKTALPEGEDFVQVSADPPIFQAFTNKDGARQLIGYVGLGSAPGYDGKILSAVVSDPQGNILGVTVLDNTETFTWMRKVERAGYIEEFAGRRVDDALVLGQDIDAVSGATFTSRGIADGVRQAAHAIAKTRLNLPIKPPAKESVTLSLQAVLALALWAVVIIAAFLKRNKLRWVTLIGGLVVLGLWTAQPLSFSGLAGLLLGRAPALDNAHLIWYTLIGGVLITLVAFGRNLYCYWLCPFGAVHELLAVATGGGLAPSRRIGRLLRGLRPVLVWAALVVVFLSRSPSAGSYEPFGTLFLLTGSGLSWGLLILVLVMGLISKRFWCLYLCPVGYSLDFLASLRRKAAKLIKGGRRGVSDGVTSSTGDGGSVGDRGSGGGVSSVGGAFSSGGLISRS